VLTDGRSVVRQWAMWGVGSLRRCKRRLPPG
jgi:hypothetical protein